MSLKKMMILLLSIVIRFGMGEIVCRKSSEHGHQEIKFERVTETPEICEKRNVVYEDKHNKTVHVCFQAFNKKFHVILPKQKEPRTPKIPLIFNEILANKVYAKNYSKRPILQGRIKGFNNSYARGYVKNNIFSGYLQTEEDYFYIESRDKGAKSKETNAIVYRYDDFINELCLKEGATSGCHLIAKVENFPNTDAVVGSIFFTETTSKLRQARSTTNNSHKKTNFAYKSKKPTISCRVNVIADHTFYQYHQKSRAAVVKEIDQIFSNISEIFRDLDFNGDYRADNFNLEMQNLVIYPDRLMKENPLGEYHLEPLDILKKISAVGQENSCLSIAFVSRDFYPKKYLGMGFLGNSNPKGPDGGICSPYEYYPGFGKGRFNTMFVTNRHGVITLSTKILQLVLFHLIGHGFGSRYDDPDIKCAADKKMFEMPTADSIPVSMTYSTCSLMRMNPMIRNKGWCLSAMFHEKYSKRKGVCGNGKVDPGEECDCGTVETCSYMDKCCVPAGQPDECTVDKKQGYNCSLLTQCCNHLCQIAKRREDMICDPWTECREQTWCEGSPLCHAIIEPRKTDGYPCLGGTKTCNNAGCNSTICRDKGLKDCDCDKVEDRCRICCLRDGKCQSILDLDLKFPATVETVLYKAVGSACMLGMGVCDHFGKCQIQSKDCVFVDNIVGLSRRGDSPHFLANYGYYILMVVVFVILAIVAFLGLWTWITGHAYPLSNFNKAVIVAREKYKGTNEANILQASRLSAMFPNAPATEVVQVVENTNTELEGVADLINKGHDMRIHFNTVKPPVYPEFPKALIDL